MKIRLARKKDRSKLLEFYRPIWKEKSEEEINKILNHNFKKENILIIAEEKNEIIGRTVYGPLNKFKDKNRLPKNLNEKNSCVSLGLLVKPSERSKGIGKALKVEAFKRASKEFERMYSTVTVGNIISLNLQKSLGLKKVGSYTTKKGEERKVFEKDLRKTL
ncbi:MAG: GNAT family N-acetyltransferase [Nanoarchaeota archaeon]|nr:GNAT family N-acetyltransferase [Nanoarchaeota archaeon]